MIKGSAHYEISILPILLSIYSLFYIVYFVDLLWLVTLSIRASCLRTE